MPRATQRGQISIIRAMPRDGSAAVADHAKNGMVNVGMKELTSAAAREVVEVSPTSFLAPEAEAVSDPHLDSSRTCRGEWLA
jgi:hypothetical protein